MCEQAAAFHLVATIDWKSLQWFRPVVGLCGGIAGGEGGGESCGGGGDGSAAAHLHAKNGLLHVTAPTAASLCTQKSGLLVPCEQPGGVLVEFVND